MEICFEAASTSKGNCPPVHVKNGSPTMGNGVIPTRWFGYFTLEVALVGNARGGQRRFEVFEGVDEILGKREPHQGIGPDDFFVLKVVGRPFGARLRILAHLWNPCSQRGPTFAIGAWVGGIVGCPRDSRPRPLGWVSAKRGWWRYGFPTIFLVPLRGKGPLVVRKVAMFLATIEEYCGKPFLREWKASSNDQFRNLGVAPCRDARGA